MYCTILKDSEEKKKKEKASTDQDIAFPGNKILVIHSHVTINDMKTFSL